MLSRALTPTMRAASLLRARVAAPVIGSVRGYADDAHGPKKQPLHKEEWLEVARNWPHEYHYPGHYRAGTMDEVYPPTKNHGHTSENPTGAETLQHRETFFSSFWTKFALALLAGTAIYRINESYSEGKEVHPLTAWLAKYQNIFTAERAHEDSTKWIAVKQKEADDRLIISKGWTPSRTYRVSFPGMFERASDHLIDVGSQVDVSDVKIKHRWEQDDDVFGPPYPKNA